MVWLGQGYSLNELSDEIDGVLVLEVVQQLDDVLVVQFIQNLDLFLGHGLQLRPLDLLGFVQLDLLYRVLLLRTAMLVQAHMSEGALAQRSDELEISET